MRILVCFKTLPEFEQVVEADWEQFSLSADLGYVRRIFGCFDETALETALRLRDSLKDAHCAALTAGVLPPPLRKTLFAAGFDEVFALSSPIPEFRPRETAAILTDLIRGKGWDLILAGRQTGYADTGMVPLLLAESLGLPAITEAETVSAVEGDPSAVLIERSGWNGRERLGVRLPAAVIMGNSPVSALRAVTLSAQIRAAKREAVTLEPNKKHAEPKNERLFRERPLKQCRFLSGGVSETAGELEKALREWEAR